MTKKAAKENLRELKSHFKKSITELSRFVALVGEKAHEETKKSVNAFIEEVVDAAQKAPQVVKLEAKPGPLGEPPKGEEYKDALIEAVARERKARFPSWQQRVSQTGFPYSIAIVNKIALVYGIMLFEEIVKEYVRVFFACRPGQLIGGSNQRDGQQRKSLDYSEILSASSVKQLKNNIIDRELDRLGHESIDGIAKFFQERMTVHISQDLLKWSDLRAAYYTRNLVVHNRAEMNKYVHDRIKLCPIGQKVTVKSKLITDLTDALTELNEHLYRTVRVKAGVADKA
ncbi:MAG: hypothetical protein OEV49_04710 [candidate division Zixibacteria bacterium]|nr:hypothetical protein [candidate division Zixibacteria bacterium]MDH3938642.1 hypothetical protein [candidate division Zixibacteria bacterium]MDH4032409.1 hypothetical protein [candidate division Zixibacteria bacterium]